MGLEDFSPSNVIKTVGEDLFPSFDSNPLTTSAWLDPTGYINTMRLVDAFVGDPAAPKLQKPTEQDIYLQNQFNLKGNSQLEKWGALARNQALSAGYSDAAAAQAGMRAKNRGWLSIAEQADEWSRRMAELAYAKKAQAAGISTTSNESAFWGGVLGR